MLSLPNTGLKKPSKANMNTYKRDFILPPQKMEKSYFVYDMCLYVLLFDRDWLQLRGGKLYRIQRLLCSNFETLLF